VKKLIFLVGLVFAIANPVMAEDPKFSIDPASPSINGNITPDDVLRPGPVVHLQGRALGLQDDFFHGMFDHLNGLSYGHDPIVNPLLFSVDRVAVGLPGSDVFRLAQPGVADAARHVYVALPPFGSNSLFIHGDQLGLKAGFFGDDLASLAFDFGKPSPNTYFSIDALSASIGPGVRPGDIFVNSIGTQFADHMSLGLGPGDDLDALVLDVEQNIALFSLSPFSPLTFTFTGLPYMPGVPGHLSPADILITHFGGSFSLWAAAADLGLRPDDNVDALQTIPEPSSLVLTIVAIIGVSVVAWRRTRHVY
jgi:hypothetical protein